VATAGQTAAEHVDEDASELLAEQTVDEEVDGRVEGQQEVGDAVDISHQVRRVFIAVRRQESSRAGSVGHRNTSQLSDCNININAHSIH